MLRCNCLADLTGALPSSVNKSRLCGRPAVYRDRISKTNRLLVCEAQVDKLRGGSTLDRIMANSLILLTDMETTRLEH